MKFSLILTTIVRTTELANFLACLELQSYSSFELIVVDQNEDDRLDGILARFKTRLAIQHLHSEKGLSVGRNRGLLAATGEIIGLPDDDCWYSQDCLEQVAKRFLDNPDIDGLNGRVLDPDGKPISRYGDKVNRVTKSNAWEHTSSAAMFIKRQVAQSIGPFDEQLGLGAGTPWKGAEDIDYIVRAVDRGFHIYYDPELVIFHPGNDQADPAVQRQRARDYGAGIGRMWRKNKFPLRRVAYYFARPVGGMLSDLLKLDGQQLSLHWASFNGRWKGYFSSDASAADHR